MEFILIVALFVYVFSLNKRVNKLEQKLESKVVPPPVVPRAPLSTQNFSPIPPPSEVSVPLPSNSTPAVIVNDASEGVFVAWIKRDFFVKLGALLLLIAFGWFVSYAFANNWIGPWGRILFGVVSGFLVLAFGAYRSTSYRQQGGIFAVLGSVIVIMSLWSARELYGFFTPVIALGLMVVPIILTASLSVKHRMPGLALASFVMASLAPFFTASPEPNLLGFFTYLLMLVVGTLWVGFLIDALFLTPIALVTIMFWSLLFSEGVSAAELTIGLVFAFAFTICFSISNIVSLIKHHAEQVKTSHVITGLGTGAYLYFWIAGATSGVFESALYAAWMALFILVGFLVYKRTNSTVALYIYGAVGLAYLVALTANLLSGVILTMTYATELALLIVATRFVSVERKARQVLSWLYVPLCLVALQHVFSPAWETAVLHRDFAALLVVTASLLISGISLRRGTSEQQHLKASAALLSVAATSGCILLWLILHAKVESIVASTLFFMATATLSAVTFSVAVRKQIEGLKVAASILASSYIFLVALSFEYIDTPVWNDSIFHFDALMLLSITTVLWLAGWVVFQKQIRDVSRFPVHVLSSLAGLYTLTLVWLIFHAVLADNVATTLSLISYTLIGLGLFTVGKMRDITFVRMGGGLLLSGVVLRLLFVEIWQLSLTMRIITFFVVGVLLISTAFIGRKRE